MSDITLIDSNFKVESKLELEDVRFYDVNVAPFKVYGVFYDEDKEDIDICTIDILNIYCDMHLKNVQESPFLFITSIIPMQLLGLCIEMRLSR